MEQSENSNDEVSAPLTEPSQPLLISADDLETLRSAKIRSALLQKDAQLAEMQRQNLLLRIYLRYSLTEEAQINEETGEVFYETK